MVVISSKAAEEAKRLSAGMTLTFVPADLEQEMAFALSRIDGAVLLDEEGRCHGAGLIVPSGEEETYSLERSRGSRYNSARRYFASCERDHRPTLIVVVSEDGYFDIFPPPAQTESASTP